MKNQLVKFIKLTTLTDKNGQQRKVIVNTDRILGIEERYGEKFGGGVQKDSFGYPKVFTEITTRGKTFHVVENVDDIYDKLSGFEPNGYLAQKHNPRNASDEVVLRQLENGMEIEETDQHY